jgi:hypothetical protein
VDAGSSTNRYATECLEGGATFEDDPRPHTADADDWFDDDANDWFVAVYKRLRDSCIRKVNSSTAAVVAD